MKISIVIPTFNRANLLKDCLDSIEKTHKTCEVETIIIINGKDSQTDSLLKEYMNHKALGYSYQTIKKSTPSEARNLGITKSSGDWILFVDDDTILPDDHLTKLEKLISENSNADIIGGPDQVPVHSGLIEEAYATAIKSIFITGKTRFRHQRIGEDTIQANEKYLTLANLAIRKSFLINNNISFSSKYFRNEENYLVQQASRISQEIYYSPFFFIYHHRRNHPIHVLKGVFSSGYHRALLFKENPNLAQITFLIPIISIIAQIYFFINYSELTNILIVLYFLIALGSTTYYLSKRSKIEVFFLTGLFHYFIPTTYGLGLIKGFFSFKRKQDL